MTNTENIDMQIINDTVWSKSKLIVIVSTSMHRWYLPIYSSKELFFQNASV